MGFRCLVSSSIFSCRARKVGVSLESEIRLLVIDNALLTISTGTEQFFAFAVFGRLMELKSVWSWFSELVIGLVDGR